MDAFLTISAILVSSKMLVSTIIEAIIIAKISRFRSFKTSGNDLEKIINDPEYPPWPV